MRDKMMKRNRRVWGYAKHEGCIDLHRTKCSCGGEIEESHIEGLVKRTCKKCGVTRLY